MTNRERYPQSSNAAGGVAIGFSTVDPKAQGAFPDVTRRVSGVRVTWSDPKRFEDRGQTAAFIRELLTSRASRAHTFHIWSQGDGRPSLMATVAHGEGASGRWVIWCEDPIAADPPRRPRDSPGGLRWAYLDDAGRWWWVYWADGTLPRSMPVIRRNAG